MRKLGEACGDESEVKSLMRFQAVIRSIFRNILSSYNFEAKYFLIIKFHERSLRVLCLILKSVDVKSPEKDLKRPKINRDELC